MKEKAPERIYINNYNGNDTCGNQWHTKPSTNPSTVSHEYIRKDISDATIQSAEDHAYFAGQEKFREKMLAWAKEQLEHHEEMLKNYPTEREYMAFVGAYQSMIDKLEKI